MDYWQQQIHLTWYFAESKHKYILYVMHSPVKICGDDILDL